MSTERKSWMEKLLDSSKGDFTYEYEKIVLDLTEVILEGMEKKGWNKSTFAEKMGVKPPYITKLLKGENLTIKQMLKVSQLLDCNLTVSMAIKQIESNIVPWEEFLKRKKSRLELYSQAQKQESVSKISVLKVDDNGKSRIAG